MNRIAVLLFSLAILLLGDGLFAQNPLRAQSNSNPSQYRNTNQSWEHQPAVKDTNLLDRILANPLSAQSNQSQQFSGSQVQGQVFQPAPSQPAAQPSVISATYATAPVEPMTTPQPVREPNFIEREQAKKTVGSNSEKPAKGESFGQIISKLGMNLAVVLALCTGLLMMAKLWMRPKSGTTSQVPSGDSLSVKEELRLGPKMTLYLIQWRQQQILVAGDAEGIKSVNVLSPTFDETLATVSEHSSNEDRQEPATIRMAPRSEEDQQIDEKILRMLIKKSGSASGRKEAA